MEHNRNNLKEYSLNINPSYSVLYPVRNNLNKYHPYSQKPFSAKQEKAKENLKNNNPDGKLSQKAVKRLRLAISWLVTAAEEKKIYNIKFKSYFKFKVNFITLTLPFPQKEITDQAIKKDLLNPFLTYLRKEWKVKNYVWKAKAQENGNIHFHLITDTYIPHENIRWRWNRIIENKGWMEHYTSKFNKMSLKDYKKYYQSKGIKDLKKIQKMFFAGKANGWRNPNSTDVHSIKGIKNIAAYVATYMAKKEEDKRPINGKIWGTSESLSSKNKCKVTFYEYELNEIWEYLKEKSQKHIRITTQEEDISKRMDLAHLFIIPIKQIFGIDVAEVKRTIKEFIYRIRKPDIFTEQNLLIN